MDAALTVAGLAGGFFAMYLMCIAFAGKLR
jgi:hypothetical protein